MRFHLKLNQKNDKFERNTVPFDYPCLASIHKSSMLSIASQPMLVDLQNESLHAAFIVS
jgi:hypothetical protein